jgi:membrane-associated phospholipid phosphatase
MSPWFQHFQNKNFTGNARKAHLLFGVCLACVLLFNVFLHYKKPFAFWVEMIGNILQIAIPAYVLVPVLWKKDGEGALKMLKMLTLILGITWAFKWGLSQSFGINDVRPRGGNMSFPSGHTAAAFCGAVFLSLRYGFFYALISLPLASFVGYTRLVSLAHWPRDVFASVLLCVIIGLFLVRPYRPPAQTQNK